MTDTTREPTTRYEIYQKSNGDIWVRTLSVWTHADGACWGLGSALHSEPFKTLDEAHAEIARQKAARRKAIEDAKEVTLHVEEDTV